MKLLRHIARTEWPAFGTSKSYFDYFISRNVDKEISARTAKETNLEPAESS
jgi:hypothetical protein